MIEKKYKLKFVYCVEVWEKRFNDEPFDYITIPAENLRGGVLIK